LESLLSFHNRNAFLARLTNFHLIWCLNASHSKFRRWVIHFLSSLSVIFIKELQIPASNYSFRLYVFNFRHFCTNHECLYVQIKVRLLSIQVFGALYCRKNNIRLTPRRGNPVSWNVEAWYSQTKKSTLSNIWN